MSTEEQTQEQFDAAEEAAFNEGFTTAAAESGLEHTFAAPTAPEPAPEAAPAAPEPEPTAPETTPETPAGEPEVAPKPVLAGLTEDQVAVALSRVSQQQATIDKLGGRIGQLMQQVEALKTVPKTASEQRSFDVKLTKLSEAFPELAELLSEDLKGMTAGAAAPAAEPAPSFTAEDVDAIVSSKLTQFQQQQERGLEVRMLGAAHPDWQDIIRTPQFALWRDNVITDGKELMESESAQLISLRLTQFKDWAKATSTPAPAPAAAPAPRQTNQRLANAVMPRGTTQAKPGEVSEEDAFALGFKAERARSGH